jgi:hypothetical protein
MRLLLVIAGAHFRALFWSIMKYGARCASPLDPLPGSITPIRPVPSLSDGPTDDSPALLAHIFLGSLLKCNSVLIIQFGRGVKAPIGGLGWEGRR